MKKRLLVFGISGFVGPYLAKEFYKYGYEIYGTDINFSKFVPFFVEFVKGDLLDEKFVSELINQIKPTHIINLAAISSVGHSWNIPQKTIEVNVIGAINILEAAHQLDIHPKVMFIGSSEEYEISDSPINEETKLNANNPYGISKITQEQFVKIYQEKYNFQIYYVRPFNHTGIGQNSNFVIPSFCKQVADIEKSKQPGTIYIGNLEAKRDFTDVRDIVAAYRMIFESNDYSSVYNVGSGKSYSLKDILNYIISLSTQEIKIQIDENKYRPIDTPVICCDNCKISEELGWNPKYTIFETIDEMFEYYMK
jgi:GDP-D-mannose dehydratase